MPKKRVKSEAIPALETKEDFDTFLFAANDLEDDGDELDVSGDPQDLEEVMNFRYTL